MIAIFVEGGDDKRFIQALLSRLPGATGKVREIYTGKGWTGFNGLSPTLKRMTDEGAVNLVIFDADFPEGDRGGYTQRREVILRERDRIGREFELFLFPDNQSDGTLETLLEQIIASEHRALLDCFDQYVSCVMQEGTERGYSYFPPPYKSKLYAYRESILGPEMLKNDRFDRDDMWDFDALALDPLKAFLATHLSTATR